MTSDPPEPLEFHESATQVSRTIFDEPVSGGFQWNIPVPASGWLRSLTIETNPSAITYTEFCDCNGMSIYRIDGGSKSAAMYPAPDGYRVPFEWKEDGRGSLPNRNAAAPYTLRFATASAAHLKVIAHSWLQEENDRWYTHQMPPYSGNVLYHREVWMSNADNWGLESGHTYLFPGRDEVLHRYWIFDEGHRIAVAKERVAVRYSLRKAA